MLGTFELLTLTHNKLKFHMYTHIMDKRVIGHGKVVEVVGHSIHMWQDLIHR